MYEQKQRAWSSAEVVEALQMIDEGWTKAAVARYFGVSVTTVYRAIWREKAKGETVVCPECNGVGTLPIEDNNESSARL